MNRHLITGATVAAALVVAILLVAGMLRAATNEGYNDPAHNGHTTSLSVAVPAPGEAIVALEALEVKGRAPKTGYERDISFGPSWADVDRNRCDTRNDMLRRDLEPEVVAANGCTVESGTLQDPYTATTIEFQRGRNTSSDVQIDHVVALSDAWQKGAQLISYEERRAFANDPLNLLAIDGPTNSAKRDSDAASWLPPNTSYRCSYVARQVSVKAKYRLWVTDAEKVAMQNVLSTCPGQPTFA